MNLQIITCSVFLVLIATGAAVDQTLTPAAHGHDVVEAVISLIRENCIFAHDKLLLRRLAYVLTEDGTDPTTYRPGFDGGIWAVGNKMFQETKSGGPVLTPLYVAVQTYLGINWHLVQWSDLRKPLYSGLAAALYIKMKSGSAGVAWAVEDQAKFVSLSYAPSINATTFEHMASLLQSKCHTDQEIDITFVVDDSSSVGIGNFQRVITFLENVVDQFHIGPTETQVSVVLFDSLASVQFYLNRYTTKNDVKTAIRSINYGGGGTNTAEAINLVVKEVFSTANGKRPVAKKVVILITDGYSNDAIATVHASDLMHNTGIAAFAIGVGDFSVTELNVIATDPDCTHVMAISHYDEIKFLTNEIQTNSCEAPLYTNGDTNVTCPVEKCPIVSIPVNHNGKTVTTHLTCGSATVYASFKTPKPSSASYEIKQSLDPQHPSVFFVNTTATSGPIYVNVGDVHLALSVNGTVKCTATIVPCDGDCRDTGVDVICEQNGRQRNCTRDDLKGLCGDDWGFANPCKMMDQVTSGTIRYPYPGYSNKFILCDHAGGAYIASCPPSTQFLMTCGYCVPDNEIAVLPCAIMSRYNLSNPCTIQNLYVGNFYFPYQPNEHKYIHCDVWGYPWVMSCPNSQVWDQGQKRCIVRNNYNPCPAGKVTGQRYWPYPCDRHRYVECDRYFVIAYIRYCPTVEVWHDSLKTCDRDPGNLPPLTGCGAVTGLPQIVG